MTGRKSSRRGATATRTQPAAPEHSGFGSRGSLGTLLLGAVVVAAVVAILAIRGGHTGGVAKPSPAPTQVAAGNPGAEAGATGTPAGIVVPTPAIPLPRTCPPNSAPQVDNVAKYGFCTPVGWGAYNENNSLAETIVMKPRGVGQPVLLPTEFGRIQILLALNTGAPADQPADCRGAPNDSIDGLATHHCTITLDPDNNLYKASKAHYWQIDLAGNRKFYMTALLGPDVTPDDEALLNTIVHAIKPPTGS